MTKKPILYFLCFVIFGCNFLSSPPAVTPNPTVLPNPQLFQPPDCIRSCWQGLRLGETNAKELEEFFASNRGIFGVYNREGNQKLYIGIHKDNYEISALVKDDVLSLVRFGPSIKLVFSDIVDALGFPNLVIINWPNSPDPAANKLSAEMYYPEAGFVFSFSRSSGLEISHGIDEEPELCFYEQLLVYEVYVVEPGTISEVQNLIKVLNPTIPSMPSYDLPGFQCITLNTSK